MVEALNTSDPRDEGGGMKRKRPYVLMLTDDEHEYISRASEEYGLSAAVIIRQRVLAGNWKRDLTRLREKQGNAPLAMLDGRHREEP
jgi:hypothetical protein